MNREGTGDRALCKVITVHTDCTCHLGCSSSSSSGGGEGYIDREITGGNVQLTTCGGRHHVPRAS